MSFRHAAPWLCAVGVLAGSLSIPAPAAAADDATVEMARARFREGVQFFDKKLYEKARLAFLQAYALKPHPSVLLNLAQSELRAGRPADAATHFSEYLRKGTDVAAAQKAEAQAGLAAARAKVAEVTVGSDTTGAQVTVDGEARGATPLAGPLYLAPGAHSIEARAGERRATRSVSVSAGQSTSVELALSGSAAPPPVAAAEPPAPAPKAEEPAKEEPKPEGKTSEAAEPAPETAQPTPEPAGPDNSLPAWFARTPLAWVGAGVGVAGLAGGVTFALLASRDYSNANDLEHQIEQQWTRYDQPYLSAYPLAAGSAPCSLNAEARHQLTPNLNGTGSLPPNVATADQFDTACSRYRNAADAGDKKKIAAIVLSSVGGAAVIGTVIYYFLDTSGKSTSTAGARGSRVQAHVTPILSPGLGGLYVTGQF